MLDISDLETETDLLTSGESDDESDVSDFQMSVFIQFLEMINYSV